MRSSLVWIRSSLGWMRYNRRGMRSKAYCGGDLAHAEWMRSSRLWMRSSLVGRRSNQWVWDLAKCGWDLSELLVRFSLVLMRSNQWIWDLAEWPDRLTANAKVKTVLGSNKFIIIRHSGIRVAVDDAVLNKNIKN